MRFKGYNFRRANNLLSRASKEGDVYANGEPVPQFHHVIVKPKDAVLVREEGNTRVYNTDDAPCISDMTGHSLTNMFYGKWKLRHSKRGTVVRNIDTHEHEVVNQYFQCTVYLMKNGRVYKDSITRAVSKKQLEIINN